MRRRKEAFRGGPKTISLHLVLFGNLLSYQKRDAEEEKKESGGRLR